MRTEKKERKKGKKERRIGWEARLKEQTIPRVSHPKKTNHTYLYQSKIEQQKKGKEAPQGKQLR